MITLMDIDAVKPSTYNPRVSDGKRLDIIELSLRKLGFLLPIFATPEGEILSGHQRPISRQPITGAKKWFQMGEFAGWIIESTNS